MSYEPTPRDIVEGRDTPEKVREHAIERAEYWRNFYSHGHTGRALAEEEKASYVRKPSLPKDTRTSEERFQSLFNPYGGVPGQRTPNEIV